MLGEPTKESVFRVIVTMEYNLWKDADIELNSSGPDETIKVIFNSFDYLRLSGAEIELKRV